jgi:hypothetical protein
LTFYFIFVVYDLVIIGATPAGIEAALLAVHLKKRVALVQQPYSGNLEASEDIFSEGYSQIFHPYKLLNHWQETAIYPPWQRLREWFYPAVSWDGQKWLQLGNRVIEVDDLYFSRMLASMPVGSHFH